jgi:GNAT superfamily N-acetyltransferase
VIIRDASFPDDLLALLELSPVDIKDPVEWSIYPTLVAVDDDGTIIGYTQFTIDMNKILHSRAIRVSAAHQGRGVAQRLMDHKIALAKRAGSTMHIYAVAKDGVPALKTLLAKLGMHHCQTRDDLFVYIQDLSRG